MKPSIFPAAVAAIAAVALWPVSIVESFTSPTTPQISAKRGQARNVSLQATTTRKSFLQDGLTATASALLLTNAPPTIRPAYADITAKLASTQALRNVKTAQKKLTSRTVVEYISTADYANIKAVLRDAPLSDLRKACTVLIRAGDDGPESDNLQTAYKTFIAKLETMDSIASVALRGRNVSKQELESTYEGAVSALGNFVAVAERSMVTPVQYIE